MKLGIPYMGSKRNLSKQIVDYIITENPQAEYFYDLFGGGGAISFELLRRGKKVFYNELNTGVCELLKKIKTDGVTPEFYNWIDRDTFNRLKHTNDWKGGLVKTCWSFGNNQKTYLFAKDLEPLKKICHEIVVNRCNESVVDFEKHFNIEFDWKIIESDDLHTRRINLIRFIERLIKGRFQLEQLQQLQQLERLERLERLQQLEISNLSYDDVIITTPIEKTIIYLDPPYINTAKYQIGLDYSVFYDWVNNNPYTCYISSYEAPFHLVKQFSHRTTLSQKSNSKTVENLYINRLQKKVQQTLF